MYVCLLIGPQCYVSSSLYDVEDCVVLVDGVIIVSGIGSPFIGKNNNMAQYVKISIIIRHHNYIGINSIHIHVHVYNYTITLTTKNLLQL